MSRTIVEEGEPTPARPSPLVGGGTWAFGAKLFGQAAQLFTFILAARVLTPTEFGFFAFCSAIAMFLFVLSEGAWAEYLMKSADEVSITGQLVTISMVSGVMFTLAGLVTAGAFYFYLARDTEALIVAGLSICILPAAVTTVYDGALVHRTQLKNQSMIRIAAEAAGLALAAIGLFSGWGLYALLASRLTLQLTLLSGSVLVVGALRPSLPDKAKIGEILAFAKLVLVGRISVFVRSYSATIAVGTFLGPTDAGFFRAAERIVSSLYELIGEPAKMIAWIMFRRARDGAGDKASEIESVRQAGNTLVPLLLGVAAPVFVGLMLISEELVTLALGNSWAPAALIVSILAAKQLLLISGCITEPLLAVRNSVRVMVPVGLANSALFLGLVVALAPFGLEPLAYGQVFAAAIVLATLIWLQSQFGGLDWPGIVRRSGFVLPALGGLACAVLSLRLFITSFAFHPAVELALTILVGAFAYLAMVLVTRFLTPRYFPPPHTF